MKNNLLSEKLVYTGDTRTPTHLHLVRYTPDEVHEYTADSLPPIEPQFSEKGMIWLQVHGLKETETVRQVCDRFGIDFLVMQDILNADHPTKVEEHERYMLVVAKFFRGGEEMQVCLVQGADFVLSFIESESPLFDDIPQAIRNNVLKFRSRPSDYLLSVLLNSITANYATLISKLDGDLDDLETGLLSTTDCRDTGGQIQELRHRYLQLKQAALPLRDQYAKLLHSDSALLHKNVRPFFNDVNDHLQYVVQQIDLCREYIRTHYGDAAAEHAVVFEDEGFSGGNLNRPDFKKMMTAAKDRKFKAIVVYRLDRISRNISDFSSLIEELGRLGIKTKTGVRSPGFPSSRFCRILST